MQITSDRLVLTIDRALFTGFIALAAALICTQTARSQAVIVVGATSPNAQCVGNVSRDQPVVVSHELATLPSGVTVRAGNESSSFRWSDSDWIARVEVTMRNDNKTTVTVDPAVFHATANDSQMIRWSAAATIQAPVAIPPGGTIHGTFAWYYNRTLARPEVVDVSVGTLSLPQFRHTYQTSIGTDESNPRVLPASVRVEVDSTGASFRWSDRDWIARATVTITNGGTSAVVVSPDAFIARSRGVEMTSWSDAASLHPDIHLAPGERVRGTLAWYYSRTEQRPTHVSIHARDTDSERSIATFTTRQTADMSDSNSGDS